MPSFDLALPAEVRFGAGRVAEVPSALVGLGASRVFVVTGRNPARSEPVRAAMSPAGMGSVTYAVPGEPTVDLVRDAVARLGEARCDAVLGFGGGSAIDVAKAVAVLAASGADPLEHLEVIGEGRPIRRPGLPCVAVPTTAGTGSEVTRNAVLSGEGVKASLRSPLLLPRVAVVDPDLLEGLPAATVASSGMDALSQVIEPFLSHRAHPVSDALAREGIRRSARSLGRGFEEGMTDPDVRQDLALASLLGGLCLANAGLGAVHGLAAALGARLGAPHGAVCAAVLAPSVEVTRRALQERAPGDRALGRLAELAVLLTDEPDATAEAGIAWLRSLTQTLAIPGLAACGLDEAAVPDVVEAAQKASSTKAHPLPLTDDEVAEILRCSM